MRLEPPRSCRSELFLFVPCFDFNQLLFVPGITHIGEDRYFRRYWHLPIGILVTPGQRTPSSKHAWGMFSVGDSLGLLTSALLFRGIREGMLFNHIELFRNLHESAERGKDHDRRDFCVPLDILDVFEARANE